MSEQGVESRMVAAASLRDWLLWLCERFEQGADTPENREYRRLGTLLEEIGQRSGAIDTTARKFGIGACLRASFDWERSEIEFAHPQLLTNRLGSPDPEALIARLVAVTGIPERPPQIPPEPDYVV